MEPLTKFTYKTPQLQRLEQLRNLFAICDERSASRWILKRCEVRSIWCRPVDNTALRPARLLHVVVRG